MSALLFSENKKMAVVIECNVWKCLNWRFGSLSCKCRATSMLFFRSGVGGPEQIVSMNSNLPARNSTF